MIFSSRQKDESGFNKSNTGAKFTLSPFLAVILIAIACGAMVGSFLLGFKAGQSNGLELALANSISQVVRSPVAKFEADQAPEIKDSLDVYAKLKEPVSVKDTQEAKPADVSKEVKDFLEPTPTPSSKSDNKVVQQQPNLQQSNSIEEKKKADSVAIEKALNDAKSKEEETQATQETEEALKDVKVIGQVSDKSKETTKVIAKNNIIVEDIDSAEPDSEVVDEPVKVIQDAKSKTKVEKTAVVENQAKDKQNKTTAKATTKTVQESTQKPLEKVKEPMVTVSKSSLPTGWYSQVAAPRSLTEAQNISNRLQSLGFKSRIETAEVRDQKYFRVVVGPESKRATADQTLIRLKKQTLVKTEPFIRMVR